MLLGHPAGLAVGSHAMAAGGHLPQSLLLAQHHGAQQLMLARQDPSSLLSSHASLVGHHGLTSASGLAVLGQQGFPGLHDYQHGLVGHHRQPGMSQAELNAVSGIHQQQQQQQQDGLLGSWPGDQHSHHSQQSAQQDPGLRKYVHFFPV